MKFLIEFVQTYWSDVVGIVLFLGIFFEITPVKICPFSPLTMLFKWIGQITTQELRKEMTKQNAKLDNFIKETKEDNQAIMRDRLTQIYLFTLKKGYIIEKDNQNFNYLLARYIANNGNSYIIDDVAPRMKTFHVYLSDEDAQRHYEQHGEY